MKNFESYEEFVEYFDLNCIVTESMVKNYRLNESNKMFYLTFNYIEVKKKSSNIFKRLLGIKDIDFDNTEYGYSLNPIIEIKVLCPMTKEVDISYIGFDGKLYVCRTRVEHIYHN